MDMDGRRKQLTTLPPSPIPAGRSPGNPLGRDYRGSSQRHEVLFLSFLAYPVGLAAEVSVVADETVMFVLGAGSSTRIPPRRQSTRN